MTFEIKWTAESSLLKIIKKFSSSSMVLSSWIVALTQILVGVADDSIIVSAMMLSKSAIVAESCIVLATKTMSLSSERSGGPSIQHAETTNSASDTV